MQQRTRYILWSAAILLIIVALVYRYYNIFEERHLAQFLTAVQKKDFRRAYELWQPAASYTFDRFLEDWGEKGEYGEFTSFEIVTSRSRGRGVVIRVRFDGSRTVDLWVDRDNKSITYSPF